MANDFFDEGNTKVDENTQDAPETIKLGDDEYTQEELTRLVGLGKIGDELEGKWNTKIDRVYPEFTKARQEAEYWKAQASERKEAETRAKIEQGQQLTQEEIKRQAQAQAAELGLMSREEAQKMVGEYLQGYQLLNEVNGLVSEMAANGNPKTTSEDLLTYMDENGVKSPEKAYKLMFEEQLEKIKEEKLQSLRGGGIASTSASSAGSKQPEPTNFKGMSESALQDLLVAATRGGGQ